MKLYIIKSVSTATPENPTYAGKVHTYYHGVGDELIGAYTGDPWIDRNLTEYMIETYGYTRLCDAKRNWSYRNPENSKFWQTVVTIEEIECPM